jgi:hypothetical protein
MGHPIETWANFQGLMDILQEQYPWWCACDAYFMRYRSTTTAISVSADMCGRFVDSFYPEPSDRLFSISPSNRWGINSGRQTRIREGHRYGRLVLVGHSEGAVVIRNLILNRIRAYDQLRRRPPSPFARAAAEVRRVMASVTNSAASAAPAIAIDPVLRAELRLFAPATFGASISGVLGAIMCLPGIGTITRTIVESFTAYKDLDKSGGFLAELRESTTAFATAYPDFMALVAYTLWGSKDKVVSMGEYRHDSPGTVLEGHDHTSICKPTSSYRLPLEFVEHA